jgi:hypothetical protein
LNAITGGGIATPQTGETGKIATGKPLPHTSHDACGESSRSRPLPDEYRATGLWKENHAMMITPRRSVSCLDGAFTSDPGYCTFEGDTPQPLNEQAVPATQPTSCRLFNQSSAAFAFRVSSSSQVEASVEAPL